MKNLNIKSTPCVSATPPPTAANAQKLQLIVSPLPRGQKEGKYFLRKGEILAQRLE